MPKFGKTSRERLETCHPDIIRLFNEVVKEYDCSILEGYRGEEKQNEMFATGKSKLKFPLGKHNSKPSKAVDVAPYPINWGDEGTSSQRQKAVARFYHFAGYVLAKADSLGIKVRWGGDWDGDKDFSDQKFDDLVHFELID